MALKYGKSQITPIIDVLEGDHETVGDAATAALAAMETVFEQRAKFVVVGQLKHSREHGPLDPTDTRAAKVSLGWYSTEGDARSAAESLWTSTSTGDEWRCWVLPVHHGTPASLHAERKPEIVAAAAAASEKVRTNIRESIRKRQQEAAERAKQQREQGIGE